MILPDYQGGSIVNLMSSIALSRGGKLPYVPVKTIDLEILKEKRNVVLLVIDGLGYEYLKEHLAQGAMKENIKASLTSVFPSGTASGITTFMTGVAPGEHGVTGWFMKLKELGMVTSILPLVSRSGRLPLEKGSNVNVEEIFSEKTFFQKIKTKSFVVTHSDYVNSSYSILMSRGAKRLLYSTISGLFCQIENAIKSSSKKKFIYAYWVKFDRLCHSEGAKSQEAIDHLQELNTKIKSFIERMRGTDTTLIVTADHGMIDTEEAKLIRLKDNCELAECLTFPLCGELRTAFCYVRPSKTKQFEKYVKEKMSHCCILEKGEELIKKNYFGLINSHPRLFDRIGDYVLIMKNDYIIRGSVMGDDELFLTGNLGAHGGLDKREMLVPLVVIET